MLKETIFENSEEDLLSKIINIKDIPKSKDDYAIVCLAKEIHQNYTVYRYYNPKVFKLQIQNDEDKKSILIWILISLGIILLLALIFFLYKFLKKRISSNNIDFDKLLKFE